MRSFMELNIGFTIENTCMFLCRWECKTLNSTKSIYDFADNSEQPLNLANLQILSRA